jgi:hypothetical protein
VVVGCPRAAHDRPPVYAGHASAAARQPPVVGSFACCLAVHQLICPLPGQLGGLLGLAGRLLARSHGLVVYLHCPSIPPSIHSQLVLCVAITGTPACIAVLAAQSHLLRMVTVGDAGCCRCKWDSRKLPPKALKGTLSAKSG